MFKTCLDNFIVYLKYVLRSLNLFCKSKFAGFRNWKISVRQRARPNLSGRPEGVNSDVRTVWHGNRDKLFSAVVRSEHVRTSGQFVRTVHPDRFWAYVAWTESDWIWFVRTMSGPLPGRPDRSGQTH